MSSVRNCHLQVGRFLFYAQFLKKTGIKNENKNNTCLFLSNIQLNIYVVAKIKFCD